MATKVNNIKKFSFEWIEKKHIFELHYIKDFDYGYIEVIYRTR